MTSDYVDNWDALPESLQEALTPIITRFDEGADLLFDRRLNLSFEAAVKELSIPGVVALTEGLRWLGQMLETRVTLSGSEESQVIFDGVYPITAYDLPLYTPCVYLSQLAQYMDGQNVRVWKEATAAEIVGIVLIMARYLRPEIEHARVCIAALHDMVYLYPDTWPLVADVRTEPRFPHARHIAEIAAQLLAKRNIP